MMTCKPGDVVDVPFPFIDSTEKKLRPALVLSEPEFQLGTGACILLMITSAERSRWPTDILLEDWKLAGLRKASILRWKLFTLDEQLVLSCRGALSPRDQEKVRQAFLLNFPNWMPR